MMKNIRFYTIAVLFDRQVTPKVNRCLHMDIGFHAVYRPIFPAYIYYVYHIDIIYKKYVLTEINRKLKFSSFRMKLILMELRNIYGIYRVNTR